MAAIIVSNGNRGLLSDNRVVVPSMPGVPVPRTDEDYDWWKQKIRDDANRVFNLLLRLEKMGHKWATRLFEELF